MILIHDLIQCYMIQIKSYTMTENDMMIYMIKVCLISDIHCKLEDENRIAKFDCLITTIKSIVWMIVQF